VLFGRNGSARFPTARFVMPGFIPGIHVFLEASKDVDGRNKSGHDN
jgi:hypothetical protein